LGILILLAASPVFAQDAGDSAPVTEEIPDFLLEDDEFGIEEGVWSDEFEDGKESTAWFVYDSNYFANINEKADRDPRYPHNEVTIYSDPINAEEVEGLLSIRGNLAPQGAGPEAAAVYTPTDLRRYKVITPDPVRGEFRATLKIAIRGRSFGLATILFNVREHDWKFDGAREARLAIYLTNPPEELTQVGYDANFDQGEYYDPLLSFRDIEAEDSVTVQLRRVEGDAEIQFWTAEDDGELEFRGRLGAPIETDLADILVALQSTGSGGSAEGIGAITIDSFTVRGPEVPDVEEGLEDQALIDLRDTLTADYQFDSLGRFDYSPAAILANRAFTWMHFYGSNQPYLLPPLPPNTPPVIPPNWGYLIDPTQKEAYYNILDTRPHTRGDRRYVDHAWMAYQDAKNLDESNYGTIFRQMNWLRTVALERVTRLMSVFRARTGQGPFLTAEQLAFGAEPGYEEYTGLDAFGNPYSPQIRIFEGVLPSDLKDDIVNNPPQIAVLRMQEYFGLNAEIQTPVDLLGRIPFLFTPEWMQITLTVYVPDISSEVIQRSFGVAALGGLGGFPGAGGIGQQASLGTTAVPSLIDTMGRGYTVVDYYGRRYGNDPEVVARDDRGRIIPDETAMSAFGYERDFPGFTDIVEEILDPEGSGSLILEWDFDFRELSAMKPLPFTQIRPTEEDLTIPEGLYPETDIPLLVNTENPNPENPRRYTMSDYFGWELGVGSSQLRPKKLNFLAAFDSPSLPLSAEGNQ
jgi:hypothetical protein